MRPRTGKLVYKRRICTVDGCDETLREIRMKMCRKHAQRFRKYGDPHHYRGKSEAATV